MADKGWDKFHASRDGFFTNFYGVVVKKGSPLKSVIDNKYCIQMEFTVTRLGSFTSLIILSNTVLSARIVADVSIPIIRRLYMRFAQLIERKKSTI
jgi:hypothetical protein